MKKYINFKLNSNFYFGKGAIEGLEKEFCERKIKKILIVAGGGSIKKNGLYDSVIAISKKMNIEINEHWGVKPNPRFDHIDEGAKIINDKKVDMVLGLGGGSVIDAAKAMVTSAANGGNIWDIVTGKIEQKNKCKPIISVITLSATGSENNGGAVVTNQVLNEKRGVGGPHLNPVATIEDPEYTYSVSKYQTASGSFDIFSHLLENFFTATPFEWTQNYIIGNLITVKENTLVAINDPKNYEARANLMFASSYSLNGLSSFNENRGSWDVHQLQHPYGAVYDIAHGAGLAMITPEWMRTLKNRPVFNKRVVELGKSVFSVDGFDETVVALEKMIKSWGLPLKAKEFKEINEVSEKEMKHMTNHLLGDKEKYGLWDLTRAEILDMHKKMAE